MSVFNTGDFQKVSPEFFKKGKVALDNLTDFQKYFDRFDTDTIINEIRDAIVARILRYNLVNLKKHGFDAKVASKQKYLEVKQCSVDSKRLGGTWNDTNEEKAKAFSDKRLYTAVAIWKGASDLQFIVYGQNKNLGKYLLQRVRERKKNSRSTQNITIQKLIIDFGFSIISPSTKNKEKIFNFLIKYQKNLRKYITIDTIKTPEQIT